MAFTITLRCENEEDMRLLTEALAAGCVALENVKSSPCYCNEMASRLDAFRELIYNAPRCPAA